MELKPETKKALLSALFDACMNMECIGDDGLLCENCPIDKATHEAERLNVCNPKCPTCGREVT